MQLSTHASYRFERGTDPGNTMYAAERTAQLLKEIAGGKIAKGSIDVYPKKIKELILKLRLSRVSKVLGFDVSKENTITILTDLGFKIDEISDEIKNSTILDQNDLGQLGGIENLPDETEVNEYKLLELSELFVSLEDEQVVLEKRLHTVAKE